jgi:hypothetical protein
MKYLLILVILFFATGAAMTLMMRLQQTVKRIAELQDELRRNEEQMRRHRNYIEGLAAAREAEGAEGEVKS